MFFVPRFPENVQSESETAMMDFSLILAWTEEETISEFELVGNHYPDHGYSPVLAGTES